MKVYSVNAIFLYWTSLVLCSSHFGLPPVVTLTFLNVFLESQRSSQVDWVKHARHGGRPVPLHSQPTWHADDAGSPTLPRCCRRRRFGLPGPQSRPRPSEGVGEASSVRDGRLPHARGLPSPLSSPLVVIYSFYFIVFDRNARL